MDYRSYAEFDAELFGLLGGALIEGGVLVDDDPREPWFLSYSHDAAVIGETLQIVEDAVKSVFGEQSGISPGGVSTPPPVRHDQCPQRKLEIGCSRADNKRVEQPHIFLRQLRATRLLRSVAAAKREHRLEVFTARSSLRCAGRWTAQLSPRAARRTCAGCSTCPGALPSPRHPQTGGNTMSSTWSKARAGRAGRFCAIWPHLGPSLRLGQLPAPTCRPGLPVTAVGHPRPSACAPG